MLSCEECNCNGRGSKNDLCDLETGQCDCLDGIVGRDCSACQKNTWNFPECKKCECNSNADSCNQLTGHCIDCRGNTIGSACET